MTFHFEREPGGPIIICIEIDRKYELSMVLDTGATHTTIDSNALHLLGYDLINSIGKVDIETANGIVETEVFEIKSFYSLGIEKKQFSNSGLRLLSSRSFFGL